MISLAGGEEIEFAIAIEVANGYPDWISADRERLRRLEGAVAVVHQDRDRVISHVAGDNIRFAIAIEVAGGYSSGRQSHREGP